MKTIRVINNLEGTDEQYLIPAQLKDKSDPEVLDNAAVSLGFSGETGYTFYWVSEDGCVDIYHDDEPDFLAAFIQFSEVSALPGYEGQGEGLMENFN